MMFSVYLDGLLIMFALAVATWVVSVIKQDVSIVDSIWSLMILAGGLTYVFSSGS